MLRSEKNDQFAAVREVGPDDEVLHVFGDIDMSTAPQLEEAIEAAAVGRSSLVLNLTKVHYLDSSGLAVLARARNRFGLQLTLLVKPHSNVLRVIRLVGFDRVFNVVSELQTSAVTYQSGTPTGRRVSHRPLAVVPQGNAASVTLDDLVWEKSDCELEALPIGVVRLDRGGRVTFINAAELTFLNSPGVDLVGSLYFEDVTPFAPVKRFGTRFIQFLDAAQVRSETIGFFYPYGWSFKEATVTIIKGLDDSARIYVVTCVSLGTN